MTCTIFLISILSLTFIKISYGMNHTWNTDDQASLFWSDVDKINEEISRASSSDEIANVPRDEKTRGKWAQDIFLQEYKNLDKYKFWNDLCNESYLQSWPILCYQLWDKQPNMKRGQECSAMRFNDRVTYKYNYRVDIPNKNNKNNNNNSRYKVDYLKCKCPTNSNIPVNIQRLYYSGLYFFITPCAAFHNSYYIMRQSHYATLEVFDIRNTTFSPNSNLNALPYQINEQTYGQPGTAGRQNEQKDAQAIENMAKDKFWKEYEDQNLERNFWNDLRNEAYKQSWPKLCLLLWNKEPNTKTEMKCDTTLLSRFYNPRMYHGVTDPRSVTKIYADVLLCTCPKSFPFYVTKSNNIDNAYFIMRLKPGRTFELEVYDLRSVVFNPTSSNTQ